jgi:hypothetical protein
MAPMMGDPLQPPSLAAPKPAKVALIYIALRPAP